MRNVSGIIKSIQDIMRKDVGVDGDAQRISQLVWMLFLKILDDREDELELLEDHYKSPLPKHLRWRAWAKDPEIGARMANARSDTAFEKPAFRSAMKARRCLIPADGFFEWEHVGKVKLPWCFVRPGRRGVHVRRVVGNLARERRRRSHRVVHDLHHGTERRHPCGS